jgi:DNA invertase Pin-like site-specific DNA recombinase
MSEKIQQTHLDRDAYVYVRQSTMHQVRNHKESRRRQYGLAGRAKQLGFRRVEVIDEDLGKSGSGTQERPGFNRLVAAICTGQVGAVLALEASRLARNNRDWHHLIDLCALTGTLVIDDDGIYDPRHINDRLLLGLRGTMSEFELNLLRQRAQEALRQMIRRGEVLWQVPIGYVRSEDNGAEMSPDRQIQDAIRGVFAKFQELGSVRQVLLWYCHNKLPLPTWSVESGNREVIWQVPGYSRVYSILTNPAYAGTYVHGRHESRTTVVDGRARRTSGHAVPRDQWEVVIHDHHPAYISWEIYVQNQDQIEANSGKHHLASGGGTGAAKSGPALLAGLLRCGRCGRKLHVGYSGNGGRVPRYYCRGAHLNHGGAGCISFGGLRPDQAVTGTLLEAVSPVGIQAALDAWHELQAHEDQKQRALRLALEQARYQADRARRQYDAVDPENRLVAGELEGRWNEALAQVGDLEERLAAAEDRREPLSVRHRERLLELGEDLPQLWNHPKASAKLKKRILRTVIEEIVVDLVEDPPRIDMRLHWAGGVHTRLTVRKNRTGHHRHRTDRHVVDLVRDLVKVCDDPSIAGILNRLGYRTGVGNTWTESRVRSLRTYHGIPVFDRESPRDWLTLEQAAKALGVSGTVVRRLLTTGTLPGHQAVRSAPWVIERKHLDLPDVQVAVQAVRDGRRCPRTPADDAQLPLFPER